VQIAEKFYVGALAGLPPEAKTLEAAAGIEPVAHKIVAAAAGAVPRLEAARKHG
jgi:hypothetical protein